MVFGLASRPRSSTHGAPPAPRPHNLNLYGFDDIAEICEQVVISLFACPNTLPPVASAAPLPSGRPRSSSSFTRGQAKPLIQFVAYALHRTRLPTMVIYQALYLLKRLKQRFPASRGSSGHRLFISALMLASKASCDDTYSNKSWTIVGQGLFTLHDINTMEHELFAFLGYRVMVHPEKLNHFASLLQHNRIQQALYIPTLHSVPPVAPSALAPAAQHGSGISASTSQPMSIAQVQPCQSAPEPSTQTTPATVVFTRSTRSSSSPLRPSQGTSQSAMEHGARAQIQGYTSSASVANSTSENKVSGEWTNAPTPTLTVGTSSPPTETPGYVHTPSTEMFPSASDFVGSWSKPVTTPVEVLDIRQHHQPWLTTATQIPHY